MAEYETVYKISERVKEDYKRAFAGIKLSEDILRRQRLAGEPNVEREVALDAMKERVTRYAKAFDIDLSEVGA